MLVKDNTSVCQHELIDSKFPQTAVRLCFGNMGKQVPGLNCPFRISTCLPMPNTHHLGSDPKKSF